MGRSSRAAHWRALQMPRLGMFHFSVIRSYRQAAAMSVRGWPVDNVVMTRNGIAVWLRTSCEITFDVSVPTPFILMLRPRSGANQWVAHEDCTLTPSVPITDFVDGYGNLCERLVAPPGEFTFSRSADVSTAGGIDVSPGAPFHQVQDLPEEVLTYLLPSRYCESDQFTDLGWDLMDGVRARLRSSG